MTKSKQAMWVTGALVFAILLGLLIQSVASGDVWLPPAKYATEYTLYFGVYDSNSPWRNYETAPAAADIHVFQDGASEAQAANSATDIGRTFSLVLTAGEMTAGVVTVDINDANDPPLYGDETWYIPTFGNASALQAFDLDSATVTPGPNSITATVVDDDAIDASAIATDAIGADEIAAAAIGSSEIATAAIGADEIAADAIGSSEIAAAAIGADEIATDAIGAAEIASAAIAADEIATNAIGAAEIAADAIATSELAATAVAEIVDAVWDELLTGGDHRVKNSSADYLRRAAGGSVDITDLAISTGTAQAGSENTITLAAATIDGGNDNQFQTMPLSIVEGTGVGQSRTILSYNGTTNVATVDKNWGTTPDSTSVYIINAAVGSLFSDSGTAQAGGNTTITLASTASDYDDVYIGSFVYIASGTGNGQTRYVDDYDGTSKVADVNTAWDSNPDGTSVYAVIPSGANVSDQSTILSAADIFDILDQWSSTTSSTVDVNYLDLILIDTGYTQPVTGSVADLSRKKGRF